MRRVLTLALLTVLAAPAGADAGTVTATGGEVLFVAAPDEVNVVAVRPDDGTLRVLDTGEPVVAGAGCTQVTPEEARCAGSAAVVEGGDGPDTLDARGAPAVTLLGGPGNDRLLGGHVPSSSCDDGGADVFEPTDPTRIELRVSACERVRVRRDLLLGDVLAWGPRRVMLGAFTVAPETPVEVVLRMGRTTLGERRVTLHGVGRRDFAVPLTRRGRARIRRPGVLRVLLRRPGRLAVGFRVPLPARAGA